MGAISGGLGVRDFDTDGAYARWAAENPSNAKMLPTVRTGRPGGHHIYFRMTEEGLVDIREEFSKNGRGAIDLGDGELRCDVGCYVLAPPSRHPDGSVYEWKVPLGDEVPLIDPGEAGFTKSWVLAQDPPCPCPDPPTHRVYRVNRSGKKKDSVNSVHSVYSVEKRVEAAIRATLPARVGQRRERLFRFARELKAFPELADLEADEVIRIGFPKDWHTAALPFIGTKDLDVTLLDFREAWECVRFPVGENVVDRCLAEAKRRSPPKCAERYAGPKMKLLVGLCRELQRVHGDRPFFLSCRDAARVLSSDGDVIHYTSTSTLLRGLVRDEILEVVERPPVRR